MSTEQLKLRKMILAALFAAITAVFAQISIPMPLVPFTGQTLAIGLAATILGARYGTLSILLYLALGAAGVPVFAEMKSGVAILVGPTGGFLVGFIPTVFIIGFIIEKTKLSVKNALIANTIGMFITLAFGAVWLKIGAGLDWETAMKAGFYPFIPLGLLKAYLASIVGVNVRKRLVSANLFPIPSNKMDQSA
ncbi:BioY family transporter [Bacillus sp. FJAT-27225]|uniref:biotin transporter BioY n=1 Tax=Bacillus sp. FJAT-27225 TaxID=1743144 RepID=UPI00080C2205|nr:biotin transporter BioY [Bacillus sp. FJAT-27225]OCA90784.1 BioY family transporter [Bacillus sp. FJAT-27225]